MLNNLLSHSNWELKRAGVTAQLVVCLTFDYSNPSHANHPINPRPSFIASINLFAHHTNANFKPSVTDSCSYNSFELFRCCCSYLISSINWLDYVVGRWILVHGFQSALNSRAALIMTNFAVLFLLVGACLHVGESHDVLSHLRDALTSCFQSFCTTIPCD